MRDLAVLELPRVLERALMAGHPWVYRDHVPRGFNAPDGIWVQVRAGRFSGFGLWDAQSPIAVRLYSAGQVPDAAWVRARVRSAWALRDSVRRHRTSAYRWIAGEGDALPGVIVDLYGPYAVLVTYSSSVESLVPWIADALGSVTPLRGLVRRRAPERSDEHELETLRGRAPPRDLVVEEYGVRQRANLFEGQKTGLYLDQRENRRTLAEHALGLRVLNLFAYTGGFSLHAALGGAKSVTSVDVAPAAMAAAQDNFRLNGLDPDTHEFVVADAVEFIERARSNHQRFDLVIADPPSFSRRKTDLPRTVHAYERLHKLGLQVTEPGGLYAASSCTAQVDPDTFRRVMAEAARRGRRRFQIIHDAGHAPDHPVMAAHREGRYLKFLIGRALPID
jgi:23S rRNA (cytosine1962-C5)-methyltransferase